MDNQYFDYYNKFGRVYFEKRSESGGMLFNEMIEIPAVLRLVEENLFSKSVTVLDIGCAFGFYTRYFASFNAKITAVDISKEMLGLAREYCSGFENINFINDDFLKVDFQSNKFDLVIGSFMLGYFGDLEKLILKIKEVSNSNSLIVLSMLHPIVQCKSKRTAEGYLISGYFNEGYFETNFLDNDHLLNLKKWSIGDLFSACRKVGLYVETIVEPKPLQSELIDKDIFHFYSENPSVIIFAIKHLQSH